MKIEVKPEWLDLRFHCEEEAREVTIREWFSLLLSALWYEGEGFSGKRPLGNSGWHDTLALPLVKAGAIKGIVDHEERYAEPASTAEYHKVVTQLIVLAGQAPPLPRRHLTFPKPGQLAVSLGISYERNREIERHVLAFIAAPNATLQSVILGMQALEPQLTDAEWSAFMFALGGWDVSQH